MSTLRSLPVDHNPLAPREVATSAIPSMRLIVVLRSDEKSDRYSLHRFYGGSVSWRWDTFTAPQHHAEAGTWIAYGGELTVGQVIERFPDHRRAILEWTRYEINIGVDVADVNDARARELRAQSLERLREELEAASAGAAHGHAA
jgi:hypothetical protein